jgi:hypothetical protein
MEKFIKFIITVLAACVVGYAIYGSIHAGLGNYFVNASFITSALLVLGLVTVIYFIVYGIIQLWKHPLFIIAMAFVLQSCSYAKSNQQVVVSTDCGMSWSKINSGDAVPLGTGNRCFMKVVMPNYPMQGDSKFIANLKDRVRANTHIDYDYSIVDPLSFIKQAKYLGKANSDVDEEGALNPKEFEGAENMVIDKRIKDVAKGLFLHQDIVELDQADLENDLLESANKVLEPLGVKLNFITLTFDLDEQTRQAIDIATAMKVYQSKELGELGNKVMEARAGATKIMVENKLQQPSEE